MTTRFPPHYYVPILRRDGELDEPILEFKYERVARTYAVHKMDNPDSVAAALIEWRGDNEFPRAIFAWDRTPPWLWEN